MTGLYLLQQEPKNLYIKVMRKSLLFIFGTRPEAIKMAPLILEAKKNFADSFDVKICVTSQHKEMLSQVLDFFRINPDYDLNIMQYNQSLFGITYRMLTSLEHLFEKIRPDIVFVQGDTTTSFVGALSAFYKKISVAHVEAGLRSNLKYSPFPEEMNRVLVSHLADYHFAPTEKARDNLFIEGIRKNVFVVGNTVIDALLTGLEIIKEEGEDKYLNFFKFVDFSKKIILVTGHRRESFGEPFKNICLALREIAISYPDVELIYPVHLNPNVREPVFRILNNIPSVHLIEPLDYPSLIWLMSKSYLILTDSGGIQEEAPSLGKPVLVMRDVTERIEGIEAGTARLVGTDKEKIIEEANNLLTNPELYKKMANAINPYGDGHAAKRILSITSELK